MLLLIEEGLDGIEVAGSEPMLLVLVELRLILFEELLSLCSINLSIGKYNMLLLFEPSTNTLFALE